MNPFSEQRRPESQQIGDLPTVLLTFNTCISVIVLARGSSVSYATSVKLA